MHSAYLLSVLSVIQLYIYKYTIKWNVPLFRSGMDVIGDRPTVGDRLLPLVELYHTACYTDYCCPHVIGLFAVFFRLLYHPLNLNRFIYEIIHSIYPSPPHQAVYQTTQCFISEQSSGVNKYTSV